jgi:hypothetical protein
VKTWPPEQPRETFLTWARKWYTGLLPGQVSFNWAATDHLISSLAARLQPLGSPQASAAGAPCAVSPPSPPPALLNASRRSIPASSCRPPARPLSPDRLIPRHSPQLQSWSRGCAASLPHFPVITGGCAAAQRHRSSSGAAPPFSAQSLFSEFWPWVCRVVLIFISEFYPGGTRGWFLIS